MENKTPNKSTILGNNLFSKTNLILLGVGVLVIVLGFVAMKMGDTMSFQALSIAPILLIIGYVVLIPVAILYRKDEGS